ncbi:hypothetical protein CAPTEDRAFT_198850 [Capitella teleta]|uniref:Uncharacterized protein n=1 Tax=Capitella teleta TaxID=283909 RepID=R7T902_CAPTE|nr:hypothetical protein CAPTEDRAFT_198850 [Capitella teleta]|eukprot:ELT87474.1 hypothetical protein CAPTEDRAFT_198850 [Capitella teleta]
MHHHLNLLGEAPGGALGVIPPGSWTNHWLVNGKSTFPQYKIVQQNGTTNGLGQLDPVVLGRLLNHKVNKEQNQDLLHILQQRPANGGITPLHNGGVVHELQRHEVAIAQNAANVSPVLQPPSYQQPSPKAAHTVPQMESPQQNQTETQLALISSLLKTLTDNIRKPNEASCGATDYNNFSSQRDNGHSHRDYPDFGILSQFPPPPLPHQMEIEHSSPSPQMDKSFSPPRHRPNNRALEYHSAIF